MIGLAVTSTPVRTDVRREVRSPPFIFEYSLRVIRNFCAPPLSTHLRGSETDYYDLTNSLLDWVLRDRKGIPLTLSIVYLVVAGGLGVRLDALAKVPRHLVLRLDDGETFIDAFQGRERRQGQIDGED